MCTARQNERDRGIFPVTEPAAILLLRYLDARVRQDRAMPGFKGRVCVGARLSASVNWWVADFDTRAHAAFVDARPASYSVAVGLDDNAARSLLGLPFHGKKLELVAGDRRVLARFVDRYLRDLSPLQTRLGHASTTQARGGQ